MPIPELNLHSQRRTLSAALPGLLARGVRADLERLARVPDAEVADHIALVCRGTRDVVHALDALEAEAATIADLRRALKGEVVPSQDPDVRLASDVALRLRALREIAPDHEADGGLLLDVLNDLDVAEAKLVQSIGGARGRLASLESVMRRALAAAIFRAADKGACIRALVSAGIAPDALDPGIAYGPEPSDTDPDGSPSRNTARALEILTGEEPANEGEIAREIRELIALDAEEVA